MRASRRGVTEGAVRARLPRLRDRFRVLLRREISHTVAGPGEIEDEIYHLMNVVAST